MTRYMKTKGSAGSRHSVYLYKEEHNWLLETFGGVTVGLRECMNYYKEHKDADADADEPRSKAKPS